MATAQWKLNLRPASFRGVRFYVDTSEMEFGRRGVTHEFIKRDKPFGEDMGRLPNKFAIDAYLIGSEYMSARDQLIAALNAEGPGELIHPYYGRQVVDCFGGIKVRESIKDGGMVTISLTFIEHGEELYPVQSTDPTYQVGIAADAAKAAAQKDFADRFSVDGLPGFVFNDATDRLNSAANTLSKISGSISGRSAAVAEFALSVRRLKSNAIGLINRPSEFASELMENVTLLAQASTAPREIFQALQKAFGYGDDDPAIPTPTKTRANQASNAIAINDLIKVGAIAEGAKAAAAISFDSSEEALAFRQSLLDASDSVMDRASDEVYATLQDLRAQVVQTVPPPGEDLSQITSVSNLVTQPSLVIAYDLYGDLDLEEDLILRNQISHPGFVPGGRDLEVIERVET